MNIFLAEERLKDKLAVAAREKLAQASKEKQMKAERKRKVAMFVNMLKSTNQQAPGQSGDDSKDDQDLGLFYFYSCVQSTKKLVW